MKSYKKHNRPPPQHYWHILTIIQKYDRYDITDVPYLCIWGHLEDESSRGSSVLIRSVTPSHHSKQMVFNLNVCLSVTQPPSLPLFHPSSTCMHT